MPAGRHRRPHARHAEVGDARTARSGRRPTVDATSARSSRAEALRRPRAPCRGDARARLRRPRASRSARTARDGYLPAADADRDRLRRAISAREVFGPVLHVLRFRREALPALIDDDQRHRLCADRRRAYAHRRDHRSRSAARLAAGNLYVNRNIIGAVVGVQPFGGHGLSGTGPKAGGPLYLKRLLARAPAAWPTLPARRAAARALSVRAKRSRARAREARRARRAARARARGSGSRSNCRARSASAISIRSRAARRRALRRRERGGDDRSDRLRARRGQSRAPRRRARRRSCSFAFSGLPLARAAPGAHFCRRADRSARRSAASDLPPRSRGAKGEIASLYLVDADDAAPRRSAARPAARQSARSASTPRRPAATPA